MHLKMFPPAPAFVAEHKPIRHWSHTFDLRLEETLKEKAELEEPSSQCRETSDRAGQPVAISLVSCGLAWEEGFGDELSQHCSMASAR
jgi:hypothetical protein